MTLLTRHRGYGLARVLLTKHAIARIQPVFRCMVSNVYRSTGAAPDPDAGPVWIAYDESVQRPSANGPLAGKRLAVELNGAIVPRSRHATTSLADDERLEIVVAGGGG